MELSLKTIIENYKRNTPFNEESEIKNFETQRVDNNKLDQWLEFFDNPKLKKLPVSCRNVDTPTGKSWGGNVTLEDTIKEIKNVFDLDKDNYIHRASENLQDYIIGLHESYDIINQEQTCELLNLLKDQNNVVYFVDNIKLNDLSKSQYQHEQKNNEVQEGPEDWEIPPKMEEITVNNKKIKIYAGGLIQLGKDTDVKLEMFKTVYDTNIAMAKNAYKSIEDSLLKDIAQEKGGEKIVKQIKTLNEIETFGDEQNKEKKFPQNTQKQEWEQYKNWFNNKTNFGKRELSDKDLENINMLFYNSFKESQIAAAQRILDLKETLQKSNKSKESKVSKNKTLEDVEM